MKYKLINGVGEGEISPIDEVIRPIKIMKISTKCSQPLLRSPQVVQTGFIISLSSHGEMDGEKNQVDIFIVLMLLILTMVILV